MRIISCAQCRERIEEILDESPTPLNSAGNGTSFDLAALQAHVTECRDCARELKLLRAARATMRAVKPLAAPGSLRANIRTRLKDDPNTETIWNKSHDGGHDARLITGAVAPVVPVAPVKAIQPKARPRQSHEGRRDAEPTHQFPNRPTNQFAAFFRRPANVAWASGLAVAVFCLFLVARPGRQMQPVVVTSESSSPVASESEADGISTPTPSLASKNRTTKPGTPAKPGPAKAATQPTKGTPAIPGLPPPPTTPAMPFPGDVAPPPTSASGGPRWLPSMPQDNSTPSGRVLTPSPQSGNNARPGRAMNGGNTGRQVALSATNRALENAARPRDMNAQDTQASSANRNDEARTGFAGPAGPPGPVAAAPTAAMKAGGSTASRAARDSADSAVAERQEMKDTTTTRSVSARITPPRNVSWGQVSVVLSGGASFAGGGRSQVLWRGNAAAGEPIELSFSVSAPRGHYSARLMLQELKGGDAQTVASDSVPISLR